MMARLFLLLAGLFGTTGVILGAYAAHGLSKVLPEAKVAVFTTGTQYQLLHAVALIGLAILIQLAPSRLFCWSAGLISVGVLLFSGSLYLLTYYDVKVGLVTPLGGVALIAGWLCLMFGALSFTQKV